MLRDPKFAHLDDDELLDLMDELFDNGSGDELEKAHAEAKRRKLMN